MASLQLAQLGFAVGDLVFAHLFPQNLTADAECGGGVLAAPVVGVQRREDTAALFFAAIATTSTPTAIAIPAIATISRLALERIALQAGKQRQDAGLVPAAELAQGNADALGKVCLLYTSPSPRDRQKSRMPSSA